MNFSKMDFSLWADYIERSFISDKLPSLIEQGIVRGATSNPAIFKEAFTKSPHYASQLAELANFAPKDKYEALAISDVKSAAKAFRGIYDASKGKDGFVSIEIDPFLANDVQASIEEGRRLFAQIDEPNVMIKVPATDAGYKVITALLNDNIAVNATLVFSLQQANDILCAVKQARARNAPIVISVFVSRFDRLLNDKVPKCFRNRIGVMNAALIYDNILKSGLANVKTLFASTGVKSEQGLSEDYYITSLLAPHSINTAPLNTIEAFYKNKPKAVYMPKMYSKILAFFDHLNEFADMQKVCDDLLLDALMQFEAAFKEILETL